ncbi:hypothetical protein ACUQZ3_004796 [Enterobacter hormaechei]|uniref:hypothetical protein n=1 Tax=Enterobacter roggenkampii TaxID=1812935 RepID=UPI0028608A55|nr:hypothetical protein [Enterobacter hormaechei]EKT9840625.1 hypothetical protein [Enterobacter hormaechei]EKX4902492.1 hypothetical protein [Enterobacter hormaechei]ELD2093648.1 hypothetical protein [Enterobacter hormaechei]ELD3417195.1 hypothetical protein [Enterobacter hormaechei]
MTNINAVEKMAELMQQMEESSPRVAALQYCLTQLEARCAALAAENAGLKAGSRFFMYSDDSGFETYKTQEEAIKAAQEMIDSCREDAYDGWPEEADTIRWGVVIQQATETDFKKPAPENGWEGSSDYKLLPETPATDAFLAEVRAQGVEMLNTQFKKCTGMLYADSVVSTAEHFADQLRKGVQS